MVCRRKPLWKRLVSGLYVPPVLRFAGQPCCCDEPCKCGNCDGATPPCCFKVVISGIVEGSCGECDCLNDTFYAPRTSACTWERNTDPYLCDSSPIKVTVTEVAGDFILKVELGGNVWLKNYSTTKPTCQDLVDESIAFSSSGSDCDASSSTCLVTAIAGDESAVCPDIPFECGTCACNLAPRDGFQVVIAGLADDPGMFPLCDPGECAQFNDTYILEGLTCFFRTTLSPSICGTTGIQLEVAVDRINVFATPVAGGTSFLFRKDFGFAPDCRGLVNESIPPNLISNCDISAATCLVTSL